MDIRIVEVVLEVFKQYGEQIRFDQERFENALNDIESNLVDERYLIVVGMSSGIFDIMIFDDEINKKLYVDLLMMGCSLSEEEALFVVCVFKEIIKHLHYVFVVENMDELEYNATQKNDILQLTIIARAYYKGVGVKQDYAKAYELYQRLYELNDQRASYYLGYMCEHGLGTEQDITKANQYYSSSDNPLCLYELGKEQLELGNKDSAISYFEKSHYVLAQYELGKLLEEKREWTSSFQAYYHASKEYHRKSMYHVAMCLLVGRGVEAQINDALKYLRYSYYCFDKDSAYQLGLLYLDGLYVDQDVQKGLHYLKQASSLHHVEASQMLGKLYELGRYVEINKSVSMKYYQQAHLDSKGGNHDENI